MTHRYKGLECDECGRPSESGFRLEFKAYPMSVKTASMWDSVEFYATFCSKACMRAFILRRYFEDMWEVNDVRRDGPEEERRD
jgi:hypothetical protein